MSIRNDILKSLYADLSKIKSVNYISRDIRNFNDMNEGEYPALFILDGDEVVDNETNMTIRETFSPVIVGYAKADEGVSEELNKILAEVKIAIYKNIGRGGSMITKISKITTAILPPYGIFEILVEVQYRHAVDEP